MSKKKKSILEVDQSAIDSVVSEVYSHAKLIAKKDFVLSHNEFHLEIKVGDDLSQVPEMYHQNLKVEQVL